MSRTPSYIWMEGELRPAAEGVVPFVNAGLHYGYSVFEGIRCYATERGPAVFRLEEHVERLLDSALVVGFRDLPYSKAQIIEAIHQVIAANGFSSCYIRPLIYLDGAMSMVVDAGKPRLLIAVWEWKAFLGEQAKEHGQQNAGQAGRNGQENQQRIDKAAELRHQDKVEKNHRKGQPDGEAAERSAHSLHHAS